MSNIGYIRVSSVGQNTERQLASIELDKVFEDKCSAKNTDRPQLKNCLEWLREGDTLHVHSIDRLARDLFDLQSLISHLMTKRVAVKFHKENLIFEPDTSNAMNQLMLHMMGAFAQFERELIKERQREGIAAAKAKGVQFGAKRKLTDEQIAEIKIRLAGNCDKSVLAREFGISRPTLYGLMKA
jgi:DNA invertase Pin-like site-specific DNA recombinase